MSSRVFLSVGGNNHDLSPPIVRFPWTVTTLGDNLLGTTSCLTADGGQEDMGSLDGRLLKTPTHHAGHCHGMNF